MEVNELRAERMAKNSNPLALVATAQTLQDLYYQTSKHHKLYAPTSKASLPTRSHATTRYKGKEIAKPITPPSESASEEDSDPEQAQKDKDMQKNLALIAKYKNDNQTGQFGNQRAVNVVGARETVGGPVVQQSGIQCFNCKEFGHYAKECRKPKRKDEEIDETRVGSTLQLHGKDLGGSIAVSGTDAGQWKEREQYFEIQDLKAQLQDKNIAISELKKLIEKCKGKSVDTKFDKPSVVRQPNAQRIPKPSILGKPAPFLDSLERKYFAKKKSVLKTNESEGLSKPVTPQNLPQTATQAVRNTNVIKPGMYRIASSTTQTRAPQLNQTSRNTNPRVSTSTGVAHKTNVSRPQPRSNQMKDKVVPNTSHVKFKKTEVEEHPRISSISNQTKSVTACNDSLNSRTSNVNAVCATCGKCVFNSNHDACVSKFLKDVNARTKKPNVVPISTRKPKSQANKSVATPHKKTVASESTITNSKSYYRMLYKKTNKAWKWWIAQQCPSAYTWVPKTKRKWVPKVRNESVTKKIVQLILFIVDSGCTKHMTGNLKLLCNFLEKYLGTVRVGNDQFALIFGYGDLVQGNITINRVYYVEGLNHNLFSVGQFCDADLELAFRKSTCFVRDLQGNDLLIGFRGSDLYTISLQETSLSTPICFMAKASPTQAWLWHRRLSHLNFDYINLLSKKDVVIGLPKLKYVKDQLCSSCEVSKTKRSSFKTKTVPSSKERLNLPHMDLCGPMRVASINGKKYILVIVDDYSR
ncbi:retrovirus-related pol polyprotein from transposon TNT 1-94 [Tanacetum coccineum]|uniref:Retrovirus-related pol polyprotein from transposon TNT 1-94 n=1 Tax=Tanacetum coccineum TaxID=301880 RepID=A0ABQ5GGP5_9ASTR